MNLLKRIYAHTKFIIRNKIYSPDRELKTVRAKLLSSGSLSDHEKNIISTISLEVHPNDVMYIPGSAKHYLTVGLSAIHSIEESLVKLNSEQKITSVLDFACGYGRVLRYLCAKFEEADITASEIDNLALDFCQQEFSINPIASNTNFNDISFPEKFHLIWCGSLLTHIDKKSATKLIKFFYDNLLPNGVCVFTMHGQTSINWLRNKRETYGLSNKACHKILSSFDETGYGYANYDKQDRYGVSVATPDTIVEIANKVGKWDKHIHIEHGWDNHQDVYGFKLPADKS